MTKIVQVAGGSASQQNDYTGPSREITVDESNHDLRVHDGVTPGGHVIQSRDNADERYQLANPELSGLAGLLPEQRGFLARLGPSDYRLRKLIVNTQQLAVTNADGFAGNPTLGLADTIGTDHTWTGQHLFTDVVQFDAGINADVSGDLTGNSAGTHTGPSVGTHTGPQIGAVDVRGQTLQLDVNQIPLGAVNTLIAALDAMEAVIPTGMIVLWSGSIASIPDGWLLCDGTLGTPDLRDRFVVGAGSSYAVQAAGGSSSHNHTGATSAGGDHVHTASSAGVALTENQMPVHSHLIAKFGTFSDTLAVDNYLAQQTAAGGDTEYALQGNATPPNVGKSSDAGAGQPHSHAITVDGAGSHNHAVTVDSKTTLPPYYALAYIMRA